VGVGVQLGPLGTAATNRPIKVKAKIKVNKNKTVLNHTPDFGHGAGAGVSSIFRRKDFLRHLRIERCQVAAMNVHLEHMHNNSCPQERGNLREY
jgi:hypothetical protein